MKIGLFIPCFVDQLYPQAGIATLELLEKQGYTVEYPEKQTCCGQPMANTGCEKDVKRLAEKFVKLFSGYDYVVAPSASCVVMVKEQYEQYVGDMPGFEHLKNHIFEICEFIVSRSVSTCFLLANVFAHRDNNDSANRFARFLVRDDAINRA